MSGHDVRYWMGQTSAFKGFGDDELATMSMAFSLRPAPRGNMIYREGAAAPSFFIVAGGQVSIVKDVPGGKSIELGRLGKNQILGLLALVDGGRREGTAVAHADSVLLECQRDDFERLFKANSPFAYKLLDFIVTDLSTRLRESNEILDQLLSKPRPTMARLYEQMLQAGKKIHESGQFTPVDTRKPQYMEDL